MIATGSIVRRPGSVAVAALAGAVGCGRARQAVPERPAAAPAAAISGAPSWAEVLPAIEPGVVNVLASGEEAADWGGASPHLGSGFVIDVAGHVVTNHHVIEDSDEVRVQFHDHRIRPAAVVGRDAETDVAVLLVQRRPDDPPTPYLSLGSSRALRVGEPVLAVGNPLGLGHSVTAGVVSATGRRADALGPASEGSPGRASWWRFIQTDASINPGYSGGPLCNARGEVVGVNTAIRTDAQGISFAIPIDMVRDVLPALLRDGRVARGRLGVDVRPVDEGAARRLALAGPARGALVSRVDATAPAHRAGLRRDDIILEFDGKDVASAEELAWMVSLAGAGRSVPMLIWRDGGPRSLTVQTAARPRAK